MIKRVLTVMIAVGALFAVSTPAQSQEYPPPSNGVFISDTTVVGGQVIIVQAGIFAPGSTVTFTFFSQPVVLGTAEADDVGIVTFEARIPSNASVGVHTIVASGIAPDGSPLEVSTTVTVLASDDGTDEATAGFGTGGTTRGSLPRTGGESLPMLRIAAALLAVGAGMVFVTRRRRAALTT